MESHQDCHVRKKPKTGFLCHIGVSCPKDLKLSALRKNKNIKFLEKRFSFALSDIRLVKRCIEFLVRMIEKYGDVLTDGSLDEKERMLKSENENVWDEVATCNQKRVAI